MVVPGGADINPKYYGEKKGKHTHLQDAKTDLLKLQVIIKCAEIGKPLFGICGGEQSLNVALGGTLKQHIPKGYHTGWRKVRIAKGSLFRALWGATERTRHYHHQCALLLGNGLKATQWDARDGYIEAIEHETLPLYGVQWHPEYMGAKGYKAIQLFGKICMRYA